MKTKRRKPMPTADFYYDLFIGGYFNPIDFLSELSDIREIQYAIVSINKYKEVLKENGLIEEI